MHEEWLNECYCIFKRHYLLLFQSVSITTSMPLASYHAIAIPYHATTTEKALSLSLLSIFVIFFFLFPTCCCFFNYIEIGLKNFFFFSISFSTTTFWWRFTWTDSWQIITNAVATTLLLLLLLHLLLLLFLKQLYSHFHCCIPTIHSIRL